MPMCQRSSSHALLKVVSSVVNVHRFALVTIDLIRCNDVADSFALLCSALLRPTPPRPASFYFFTQISSLSRALNDGVCVCCYFFSPLLLLLVFASVYSLPWQQCCCCVLGCAGHMWCVFLFSVAKHDHVSSVLHELPDTRSTQPGKKKMKTK